MCNLVGLKGYEYSDIKPHSRLPVRYEYFENSVKISEMQKRSTLCDLFKHIHIPGDGTPVRVTDVTKINGVNGNGYPATILPTTDDA